jgi:hypothetical protein
MSARVDYRVLRRLNSRRAFRHMVWASLNGILWPAVCAAVIFGFWLGQLFK